MLARGQGSIVNVASVASSITGVPNRAAYGTTKAAVIGLTKSVAADFVARGIRCNALCPGTVDTPLLRKAAIDSGDPEAFLRGLADAHPIGRIASADEIARFFLFLASDHARFFTGAVLMIDGGFTAR